MQSDRELLELAAKACGYSIHIWGTKGRENCAIIGIDTSSSWNPLVNDGAAIGVAIKLQLDIEFYRGMGEIRVSDYQGGVSLSEPYSDDMNASTRRAITRAAAAIGEKMP